MRPKLLKQCTQKLAGRNVTQTLKVLHIKVCQSNFPIDFDYWKLSRSKAKVEFETRQEQARKKLNCNNAIKAYT
jgi:hypothetical protein